MGKQSTQRKEENVFAQSLPIVSQRIQDVLTADVLDQITEGIPVKDRCYQGKLLNYALIELGVTGLGACNGVPFDVTSQLASRTAKGITLAFELAGKDSPVRG